MTGLKAKRQRFSIFSLLFLCIFGAVFASVGFFILYMNHAKPGWTRTTGQIVSVATSQTSDSTIYTPIVQYTVDEQTYEVSPDISTSTYPHVGEDQEVAYNPAQPAESKVIQSTRTLWFLYLFPIFGIVCFLLAPYLFITSVRRSSAINRLMQNGLKLQGVLVEVQTGSNNNGVKIVVSATNPDGVVRNYVSDTIKGGASIAMADFRTNPIPIDVYINPSDADDYYVDIADIPNLTPQRIQELIATAVKPK
jgi:hypothetical protein